MPFAVRRPDKPYFAILMDQKVVKFTRDQEKATFFGTAEDAWAAWDVMLGAERDRLMKEVALLPKKEQLGRLENWEEYAFDALAKRLPIFKDTPLAVRFPGWVTCSGKAPLFEVPDPEAISEQISIYMPRLHGKWIVSRNNAEGFMLSDSCDKAPTFLSKEAGLHFLSKHISSHKEIVFIEMTSFAKKASYADENNKALLGDFEQWINARSEGREIRLMLEDISHKKNDPTEEVAAPRRKNTL